MLALLPFSGLLFLCDHYRWLSEEHYALLTGTTIVAVVVFSVPWFAAALRPRWRFSFTPEHALFALLAANGCLLLSEQVGWLHKGYAVLLATASSAIILFSLLLWFAAAILFHRRFQFTIRSLLVLTAAVAVSCSCIAVKVQQARRQKEAVAAIVKLGGTASYDYDENYHSNNEQRELRPEPQAPEWMQRLLGEDLFSQVVFVWLCGSPVTDTELEPLKGLTHPMWLRLHDTQVTDEGLKKLRQALPRCKIEATAPVASISGNDRLTVIHILYLLGSKEWVPFYLAGSKVQEIQVPKQHAVAAIRLLREDSKKRGYWIAFGNEVHPAARATPKLTRLPIDQVLKQPGFAADKPLGRFLRSGALSAEVHEYPFLVSLGVREREFLGPNFTTQIGYEGDLVLQKRRDDDSQGYRGSYQVWDEGRQIESQGGSRWDKPAR